MEHKEEGKGMMKSMARKPMNMEAKVDSPGYPSLSLEEKNLPGLKGKTVGDKVMMKVELCIKGIHKYGDGDTQYSMDIERGMVMRGGKE